MAQKPPFEPTLPHSPEAEHSILGAILLDNHYLDVAAEILKSDDFFFPQHKRIFSVMLSTFNRGKPIDMAILTNELNNLGVLNEVGGASYVSSLTEGVARVINVKHYANIVLEKSHLRSLAYSSNSWKDEAVSGKVESKELVESIDVSLNALRDAHLQEEAAPKLLKEIIDINQSVLSRIYSGEGALMGLPIGYAELDARTGGWMAEDFVVLGSRPSAGKTSLLVEFAIRQARAGNPVLIFSLEMTRVSLLLRMISNVGGIDSNHLRVGNVSDELKRKVMNTVLYLSELPIWISDPTRMYSHEIISKVRYFASRYKVRLVMVDYLQLLRAKAENRVQEIGRVSQDLKEAARILGKVSQGTLLAAAQLSRLDPDEEPQLSNLRESGSIEQDADLVMFLWNNKDAVRPGGSVKNVTIAKQRNGPIGKFNLLFRGEYTSFEAMENILERTQGSSFNEGTI